MDIFVTLPTDEIGTDMFPNEACDRLKSLGSIEWNPHERQLSRDELRDYLSGTDVLVTRWTGCPRITDDLLTEADDLQLLTHVGGAVPAVTTEAVYDHGATVCSAVRIMASFVAEGTLAHILTSLRGISEFDSSLKAGDYDRDLVDSTTLFDRSIGLVGLGSVGQELLKLLEPFDVTVRVYDPYVSPDRLTPFDFASKASLDTVLKQSDVVSVHAAKTEETIHLLDAEKLRKLQDGALLVNTARGAIVDEEALASELESGRIDAALDVFQREPLPEDSPLRAADNTVLTPHVAGAPTGQRMALAMIDEIDRFVNDEPLQHRISRERFHTMTDNTLAAPSET